VAISDLRCLSELLTKPLQAAIKLISVSSNSKTSFEAKKIKIQGRKLQSDEIK